MTPEEVKSSVGKIKEQQSANGFKETFYAADGKMVDSPDKAVAAETQLNNTKMYKILVDADGRVFNPSRIDKKYFVGAIDQMKRAMFSMRAVNKVCFDAYMQFLGTLHPTYLVLTERNL